MNYEEVLQRAFFEELQKIAASNGGSLPGMSKVALSFGGLGKGIANLASKAPAAAHAGEWVNAAGKAAPIRGGGPGIFQRYGKSLMEGGNQMRSAKFVAPGKMGPASPLQHAVGDWANSVGHHYAHKGTLANLANPLGGVLGGTAESAVRTTGKQLVRGGAAIGAQGGGGALANAAAKRMGQLGAGLQKAAPMAGKAGELAGLAGLGAAVHAPLSAAGVVGHHVVGGGLHGLAQAAPAAAEMASHAIHGGGEAAAHGLHDVVGTASQSLANRAKGMVGRVTGAFAPAMGAA